jgi:ankyrin repeat protein
MSISKVTSMDLQTRDLSLTTRNLKNTPETQVMVLNEGQFSQHHVVDRIQQLHIDFKRQVTGFTEQDKHVAVLTEGLDWSVFSNEEQFQVYMKNVYFVVTQYDENNYLLRSNPRGLGGGQNQSLVYTTSASGLSRIYTNPTSALKQEIIDWGYRGEVDYERVKHFIDAGANVNATALIGTPLLAAVVVRPHLRIAELLLNKGADPNIKVKHPLRSDIFAPKISLLCFCAASGNDAMARLLIRAGAKTDDALHYALQYSVSKSKPCNIVKTLLESGIDPNQTNPEPFSLITKYQDSSLYNSSLYPELARMLIKAGEHRIDLPQLKQIANLLKEDKNNNINYHHKNNTLLIKCLNENEKETAKILIESNVFIKDKNILHISIKKGWIDVVTLLIANGFDVNEKHPESNCTPLFTAVETGSIAMVTLLLNNKAKDDTDAPFLKACELQSKTDAEQKVNEIIAHQLIKYKAIPITNDLLHAAVKTGWEGLVDLLISQGCNVNAKHSVSKQTPLTVAVECGLLKIFIFLLKHSTKLQNYHNEKELAQMLIQAGASLNYAFEHGHEEMVIALINGDVFIKHNNLLHKAVQKGWLDVVILLQEKGLNINANDPETGLKLLDVAIENEFEGIAIFLKQAGAEVSTNMIINAFDKNLRETVKALIKNTFIQDNSLLHRAVQKGWQDVVISLQEKGLNINAIDPKTGHTPLDAAIECESEGMVALLLQRGAKVSTSAPIRNAFSKDLHGIINLLINSDTLLRDNMFLHEAVKKGWLNIVSLMIEKKFDVNSVNPETHHTPLSLAIETCWMPMCMILIQNGANFRLVPTSQSIKYTPDIHGLLIAPFIIDKIIMRFSGEIPEKLKATGKWQDLERAMIEVLLFTRILLEFLDTEKNETIIKRNTFIEQISKRLKNLLKNTLYFNQNFLDLEAVKLNLQEGISVWKANNNLNLEKVKEERHLQQTLLEEEKRKQDLLEQQIRLQRANATENQRLQKEKLRLLQLAAAQQEEMTTQQEKAAAQQAEAEKERLEELRKQTGALKQLQWQLEWNEFSKIYD